MTWTEFSRSTTRPLAARYVPPHELRNDGEFASRNMNSYGFHSESTQYDTRQRGRRGTSYRGRGGRGNGRGRWSRNRREVYNSNSVQNQDSFDVSEKFGELEVSIENVDDNNGGSLNFGAYEDIPVEASGSDVPSPVNTFDDIDLGAALNSNIKRCKYVKPTPVQRHAIPIAVAGRDLMACAQTGSGKTAAFCFPIISGILKKNLAQMLPDRGSRIAYPAALILSPTRELSSQIHDEAKKFAYQTGVRIVVAYGGSSMSQQLCNLERGVDILVATPGRLVDMIDRGKVSLSMVKYLALDEADRMLDMGFEPQVRKIVEEMDMPPPGARQTLLFSATFPNEIQRLASDFLSNYIFLTVGRVGSSTDLILQKVEFVNDMDKRDYLKDLLSTNVANGTHGKHALTLIFVETKRGADALEHWLCSSGFPAIAIHGDKIQMEREHALRRFRTGATPILVATDVAARGLDVPRVAHVINFDLPKDIDDYVHRIGRTGRAGKSGLATAFFSNKNQPLAKALLELMQEGKQDVPTWLNEYAERSSQFGSRPQRSGGSRFGGYDFRKGSQSGYGYGGGSVDSNYYDSSSYAPPYGDASHPESSYGYGYSNEPVVATGWD